MNFSENRQITPTTFQSVGDLLSGKYRRNIPSVIPFVINMMNSVHNLPTNLPTESPTEFILSVIPLVKMTRHHFFFCFVLIFFPTVIPSVFPFVFINFLVVFAVIRSCGTRVNYCISIKMLLLQGLCAWLWKCGPKAKWSH